MIPEIKGVPRETCYYSPDKQAPNIYQAGCSAEWIVLQDEFLYCPFCCRPIEKNPPAKPRNVS